MVGVCTSVQPSDSCVCLYDGLCQSVLTRVVRCGLDCFANFLTHVQAAVLHGFPPRARPSLSAASAFGAATCGHVPNRPAPLSLRLLALTSTLWPLHSLPRCRRTNKVRSAFYFVAGVLAWLVVRAIFTSPTTLFTGRVEEGAGSPGGRGAVMELRCAEWACLELLGGPADLFTE